MKSSATAIVKYLVKGKTTHSKYHSMTCSEDDSLKTIREHFEKIVKDNKQENVIEFHSVELIPDRILN